MLLTGAALSRIGDDEPAGIAFLFELYHNQDITQEGLNKLRWAKPLKSFTNMEKAFGASFCASTSKGFTFLTRAGIRDPNKKTFQEHVRVALEANDIQTHFHGLLDNALKMAEAYETAYPDGDGQSIVVATNRLIEAWTTFERAVVQTVGISSNACDDFYEEYAGFTQDSLFEEFHNE
jgi:hypothetical protein